MRTRPQRSRGPGGHAPPRPVKALTADIPREHGPARFGKFRQHRDPTHTSRRSERSTFRPSVPTPIRISLWSGGLAQPPEGGETKNNGGLTAPPPSPPVPRRIPSARTARRHFLRRPDDMAGRERASGGRDGGESSEPAACPPSVCPPSFCLSSASLARSLPRSPATRSPRHIHTTIAILMRTNGELLVPRPV